MDRISQLHDEILLDILSLLPSAKDVVVTMVLSKRWQFLWTMVPRLVYDDTPQGIDSRRFSTFVDRSLILHKAPVLDTLQFKLGRICHNGDTLIKGADKDNCCVRKLIIDIDDSSSKRTPVRLPTSLYSGRDRMLVTLTLSNVVLLDVSTPISFPTLKNLSLTSVKYPGDEFVNKFLSSCPVLEDLGVEQCRNDNVTILNVRVPSLKRLSISVKPNNNAHGIVIDAPSLESLMMLDYSGGFRVLEHKMCEIVNATLDFCSPQTEQLLDSLTSAKRLLLCLPSSKDAYHVGRIFRSLVHLTICTCETEWLDLLKRVLRNSPNLKTLKIQEYHYHRDNEPRPCWDEKSVVPEYLLPSLENFEWFHYGGTKTEKEVVAFILKIASCLKQATIICSKSIDHDKKLEMLNDFPLSSRRSPACLLAFRWNP